MKRAASWALLAVISLPCPALADETETAQCISSHVEAQRLRRDGKLRAARDALVQCANPSCPTVLVEECSQLLTSVNRSIPTLVFEARDATGQDIADARVLVGTSTIAERLDGKAIALDPGEYTFRFERQGAVSIEIPVVVREGDSARRIAVKLVPIVVTAPELERRVSPVFWVAGALGLASIGAFGGLAGAGFAGKNALEDAGCKPTCAPAEVDEVRRLFVGADVMLGVGVAALVAAPIIYFLSPLEPVAISLGAGSLALGGSF